MDRAKAKLVFNELCAQQSLQLSERYFDVVCVVTEFVETRLKSGRQVMGVSGAQGSGKSTFSHLLANLLGQVCGVEAHVICLDDFYLDKQSRYDLSSISPLLATRGVPGTHKLSQCEGALNAFRSAQKAKLPTFSKALDNPGADYNLDFAPTQLLILEGWCWGAKPVPEIALQEPLNILERDEDVDGQWRAYVNQQLVAYQSIFKADFSLILKVPDFGSVLKWRSQQEARIEQTLRMTSKQLERFVMHYERITRQLLSSQSADFDIAISLDKNHELTLEKIPLI